jgi:adenosylcobinamide kinase/adenosylcobinamide-phosphate guanylyltransferase
MGLQLVVGGAYSGKRNVVRDQYDEITLYSAYNEELLTNWRAAYHSSTILVLEGWEEWIKSELCQDKPLEDVRTFFFERIDEICEVENSYDKPVILIMLEMGRGIVPLKEEERTLRDIAGWVLQYAANKADSVQYCWHGLVKPIK